LYGTIPGEERIAWGVIKESETEGTPHLGDIGIGQFHHLGGTKEWSLPHERKGVGGHPPNEW